MEVGIDVGLKEKKKIEPFPPNIYTSRERLTSGLIIREHYSSSFLELEGKERPGQVLSVMSCGCFYIKVMI
jgi:hypothetical protein